MSFQPSTTAPDAALRIFLAAALSGLCLAGCGGDDKDRATAAASVVDAATSAATTAATTAATSVRLEGCVVDALWLGAPGVTVHARGADGRAIGAAFTDSRGVFQIMVPARSRIVVDTAMAGPGGLELDTGSTPLTVAGCLTTGA